MFIKAQKPIQRSFQSHTFSSLKNMPFGISFSARRSLFGQRTRFCPFFSFFPPLSDRGGPLARRLFLWGHRSAGRGPPAQPAGRSEVPKRPYFRRLPAAYPDSSRGSTLKISGASSLHWRLGTGGSHPRGGGVVSWGVPFRGLCPRRAPRDAGPRGKGKARGARRASCLHLWWASFPPAADAPLKDNCQMSTELAASCHIPVSQS